MNKSFHYNGITYYPDIADDDRIYYLYEKAIPQTDTSGNPTLSLTGAGAHWFLQLGTKWQVPEARLEELRKKLTDEKEDTEPVDLLPAPVTVQSVELMLHANNEDKVLARSGSSGHLPFSAVFSASVPGHLQSNLVEALHGSAGKLVVVYHAQLDREYAIRMELSGSIAGASDRLTTDSTDDDIRQWIDEQIKSGTLVLQKDVDQGVPEETVTTMETKLYATAIDEIRKHFESTRQADDAMLDILLNESITLPEKFDITSDVGTWFSGREADEHIKIIA